MADKVEKGSLARAFTLLAVQTTAVFLALRADGVIGWSWYWLVSPMVAVFLLLLFAAVVAALMTEM